MTVTLTVFSVKTSAQTDLNANCIDQFIDQSNGQCNGGKWSRKVKWKWKWWWRKFGIFILGRDTFCTNSSNANFLTICGLWKRKVKWKWKWRWRKFGIFKAQTLCSLNHPRCQEYRWAQGVQITDHHFHQKLNIKKICYTIGIVRAK